MCEIYTLIDNRHNDLRITCSIAVPYRYDIDVDSRCSCIVQAPEIRDKIVEVIDLYLPCRFDVINTRNSFETFLSLCMRNNVRIFHDIPAVKSFLPGTRLKFTGMREKPLHLCNAKIIHDLIKLCRLCADFTGSCMSLDHGCHILTEIDISFAWYINIIAAIHRILHLRVLCGDINDLPISTRKEKYCHQQGR